MLEKLSVMKRTSEKEQLSQRAEDKQRQIGSLNTLITTSTTTGTESVSQSGPSSSTVTGGADRSREMQGTNNEQQQTAAPTASTSAQTSYENQLTASCSAAATHTPYHMILLEIGVNYHCPFCDSTYTRMENLKKHMLKNHNTRIHSCRICHKTFIGTDSYVSHIETHEVRCNLCQRKFRNETQFRLHIGKCRQLKCLHMMNKCI